MLWHSIGHFIHIRIDRTVYFQKVPFSSAIVSKLKSTWQHQNRNRNCTCEYEWTLHMAPLSHQMKIYEMHRHFDRWHHHFLSSSKSAFKHIDVSENRPTPISWCRSFVLLKEKNRKSLKLLYIHNQHAAHYTLSIWNGHYIQHLNSFRINVDVLLGIWARWIL